MPLPEETDALIQTATAEAATARAEAVEPLHLLIAVCRSDAPQIRQAFEAHGIDHVRFRRRARGYAAQLGRGSDGGAPLRISTRVQRLLEIARREGEALERPLDAVCVLVALLRFPDAQVAQVFERESVPALDIAQYYRRMLTRITSAASTMPEGPAQLRPERPPTPALDAYGRNCAGPSRGDAPDPVIGREREIKQVVRVLLRKQRNAPLLVGEVGVGKTRIVEALASRAGAGDAPDPVRDMRVVELRYSALAAGVRDHAEFEERLGRAISEAESEPNIVLFLDQIQAFFEADRGAFDASGALDAAFSRGRLRCIGATTPAKYRRLVERQPDIERWFHPIQIEEPGADEARQILEGLRPSYESFHGVAIEADAIDAAIDLSVRYILDRRLPDKACDLIDQAAANARFRTFSPATASPSGDPLVRRDDVALVVAELTGLDADRLSESWQQRLSRMEEGLGERIVGQDVAVATVSRVVRTGLAGLGDPVRPRSVLLFVGPSGVGKTELAAALAEYLFDDPARLIRFDMSEFCDEGSLDRLLGEPSDGAGSLVDRIRRAPYSVVLFEELERAHPKVADVVLRICDEGRIKDCNGRSANFRNTIVVLTSAVGSAPCGVPGAASVHEAESPDDLRRELLDHFRPELLNRVSRIVPFRSLDLGDIRDVIDRILERLDRERLSALGVELRLAPSAYDALIEIGYRPTCGVGEMERAIERQIVEPLAQGVVDGTLESGDVVEVLASEGGLVLRPGGERNSD